jgi:hypothetical protein
MAYASGQVTATTTATSIVTTGPAPNNDSILISSSAAAYIGGAGVTTATGFPIAANQLVLLPTTGAENPTLYGVVASGTATISYLTIT